MVTNASPIPGASAPSMVPGIPVTSGAVLGTVMAELHEMFRELNQNRLTLRAVDRLCDARPDLRADIIATMQALLAEQATPPAPPPERSKRSKRR